MHINIIAQQLKLSESEVDRLVRLGRLLVEEQHDVTIITGSSSMNLNLGNKKIALVYEKGMSVIVLNAPGDQEAGKLKKIISYLRFAYLAGRQGKMLPKPDLILALAPPLTAVKPALELSEHYKVPLVVDMRELWPDDLVERNELRKGLLVKVLKRFEEKVYNRASKLIVGSDDMADIVKEKRGSDAGLSVINEQMNEDQVYLAYKLALGVKKQ